MSVYTDFERSLYAEVVMDVRKWKPTVNLRDAYVMKVGKDHWEFRYLERPDRSNNYTKQGEFYWHGSASGAFEARAKGWSAWLETVRGPAAGTAVTDAASTPEDSEGKV
jgi:hypothetical protein